MQMGSAKKGEVRSRTQTLGLLDLRHRDRAPENDLVADGIEPGSRGASIVNLIEHEVGCFEVSPGLWLANLWV